MSDNLKLSLAISGYLGLSLTISGYLGIPLIIIVVHVELGENKLLLFETFWFFRIFPGQVIEVLALLKKGKGGYQFMENYYIFVHNLVITKYSL